MEKVVDLITLIDLAKEIIENFGTNEFTQKDYEKINEYLTTYRCRSILENLYYVGVLVRTKQEFTYTNPLGEDLTSVRYIYKLADGFENKIYNRAMSIQENYHWQCVRVINDIEYKQKREQRYACNFIELGYYCPNLKKVLGVMYKYKIKQLFNRNNNLKKIYQ